MLIWRAGAISLEVLNAFFCKKNIKSFLTPLVHTRSPSKFYKVLKIWPYGFLQNKSVVQLFYSQVAITYKMMAASASKVKDKKVWVRYHIQVKDRGGN